MTERMTQAELRAKQRGLPADRSVLLAVHGGYERALDEVRRLRRLIVDGVVPAMTAEGGDTWRASADLVAEAQAIPAEGEG